MEKTNKIHVQRNNEVIVNTYITTKNSWFQSNYKKQTKWECENISSLLQTALKLQQHGETWDVVERIFNNIIMFYLADHILP